MSKDAKKAILNNVDIIADDILDISRKLKENPEIGFKECKALKWLTEYLENKNFNVEKSIAGLETSFRARYVCGNGGPKIAFLCEYDALPEIGHGCGHNLIAPSSVGAAVALSTIEDLSAELLVIGCPGEENGGGKVILTEKGVFNDVDIAMIVHPATVNLTYSTSLALDAIEFTFKGRTAHASSMPEKGINALDSTIFLFNGLNALRQHLKDDVRIHGIISEGGQAPNVVPDKAVAKFYFRAKERSYLNETVEKAYNVARGAALMTGAEVTWRKFELSNDNLRPNRRLARVFEKNLKKIGIKDILPPQDGGGSTDMGNVSQVIPAIHPYIAIGEENEFISHSREFADATVAPRGQQELISAAKAMALTAFDVVSDKELLKEIKKEFKEE
ncbi:MAG: M20 family metallopeptidase [Thermotogota bacterium]|nr:M20 family metallopeptidase [Thermotogota bacterium]